MHSFRRAVVATLAESGVSIVTPCHSGSWKSCKTAELHIEHSKLDKSDRAIRLDGRTVEPSAKRPRLDECTTSKVSSDSRPSVIHGNYDCISFYGFNSAKV